MKNVFSLACGLVVIGLAAGAGAQPSRAATHVVGNSIGGHSTFDSARDTETETITLTFPTSNDPQVYTIDFVARHQIRQPVSEPGVVDMIVTQQLREDDAPEMTLSVDGETLPLVTRLHSRRSVVASMSLNDFDRIASAGTIVDNTFGVELEFSPGQVKMLRMKADRWLGRVR